MSKSTPAITAKLAFLVNQIKIDWKAFNADFTQALTRAESAAVSGWQIGKAILEYKEMVGHGALKVLFPMIGIPERTCFRFMFAAKEFPELKAFMANRRELILASGILPEKEHLAIQGNISTISDSSNHSPFLTKFLQWTNEVKAGKLKMNQDQVRNDLRPVYEWLKDLYGE